jgi:cyclic di-GMP phosphodiesterase
LVIQTASQTTPAPRRSRILVADDTESIRALFRKLLARDGHEVIDVGDGEAALAAVYENHPDVVLLDITMPQLDGLEVCRRLKSDPATRFTPVVLVTGLSDLHDRIKGIEAGADEFLSKPVHPLELRARVGSLTRMKHLLDALDSAEAAFMTLALTIEARDPTTNGHCERLARHAVALGKALGLGEDDLQALNRGGFLHDVGKVGIRTSAIRCARLYSRCAPCGPSCGFTTNGWTAAATRWDFAAMRCRCSLRLSGSRTCMTP